MDWLATLFGHKNDLDIWQECARAILIFVYGLLLVRVAGRRIFGKWSALDIVLSIIIGSNLSRAMTGGAPLGGTLAATTLLVVLHWLLAQMSARVPAVSNVLEGRAIVIRRGGETAERDRTWHAISHADLAEAPRQSGVEKPEDADRITLEPSGKITVLKHKS
jgi:uncharacterized membrane protein YcaP (DUF421 family)